MLQRGLYQHAPLPLHTFISANTAVHLSCDPSYSRMTITEAAKKFNLPDLCSALGDFISNGTNDGTYTISGCRSAGTSCNYDIDNLNVKVWNKVQVQNCAYHSPHDLCPPQTINASPPSTAWPSGHADAVLVNTDPKSVWPKSGINGIISILLLIHKCLTQVHRSPSHATATCFLCSPSI